MILNGNAIAREYFTELKRVMHEFTAAPRLAVIRIGSDPASEIYVRRKQKVAEELGIVVEPFERASATTEEIVAEIRALNSRDDVDAILVQLPLPADVDTDAVISAIDPLKDVDGFHPSNIIAFTCDVPVHTPVLILAILWLLKQTHAHFENKHAVIIGKSDIFLEPLTHALEKLGLTVSWIRPEALADTSQTNQADLIIVAVGKPNLISADYIKTDATIIDIGINRLPNGTIVGDVDFEEANKKAAWITPTPGGVGPVTIAALMANTLRLHFQHSHRHEAERAIDYIESSIGSN